MNQFSLLFFFIYLSIHLFIHFIIINYSRCEEEYYNYMEEIKSRNPDAFEAQGLCKGILGFYMVSFFNIFFNIFFIFVIFPSLLFLFTLISNFISRFIFIFIFIFYICLYFFSL